MPKKVYSVSWSYTFSARKKCGRSSQDVHHSSGRHQRCSVLSQSHFITEPAAGRWNISSIFSTRHTYWFYICFAISWESADIQRFSFWQKMKYKLDIIQKGQESWIYMTQMNQWNCTTTAELKWQENIYGEQRESVRSDIWFYCYYLLLVWWIKYCFHR